MTKSFIDMKLKDKTVVTVEFNYSSDIYQGKAKVIPMGKGTLAKKAARLVERELGEPMLVYIPELGGPIGDEASMEGVWSWVVGVCIAIAERKSSPFDGFEFREVPSKRYFKKTEPLPKGAVA